MIACASRELFGLVYCNSMTRTEYLITHVHECWDRAAQALAKKKSLKDNPQLEPAITNADIAKEAVAICSSLADALGLTDAKAAPTPSKGSLR